MGVCILDTQELVKAQLAMAKLSSKGIFSELRTNDAKGTLNHLRFVQGVQLYVSEKDLQKSKEILEKEDFI